MKRSQAELGQQEDSSSVTNKNKTNNYSRFLRDEPKQSLLIATSRPPAVTTSGTGGTLNIIDLQTGSLQASTRLQGGDLQHSKQQLGLQSLSLFPLPPDKPAGTMAIAYGINEKKENDSFAILMTIRNSDELSIHQNPVAHWRCRLPEIMSAGLVVSPVTSRHIVGAGASGSLYVWDVWNQGNIIRTAPNVHYRAISCMIWSKPMVPEQTVVSPWDCHLITGGADGMVHVFTHADLVEDTSDEDSSTKLAPVRTWSRHQLAVKALVALEGNRFASSGDDGLVLLMDISSESVLLSVQLPNGIHALAHDEGRILAGTVKGTIHRIEIDEYAAERAEAKGALLVHQEPSKGKLMELKGHTRPISALAILSEDEFVSGDEAGVIRVWDHDRCIRVIKPWNSGGSSSTETQPSSSRGSKPTPPPIRPVSAIHVLNYYQGESTKSPLGFVNSRPTKSTEGWPSLCSPLQKYPASDDSQYSIPIPFAKFPRFDPPPPVDDS